MGFPPSVAMGGYMRMMRVSLRRIPLPADPEEGEAALQEKAVAELFRCIRRETSRREVEERQEPLASPIPDLEKESAVALSGSLRLQEVEVRRMADPSVGIDGSFVEIGHDAVRIEPPIEAEVQASFQDLVRAGETEALAIEDVPSALDVDAHELGSRIGAEAEDDDRDARESHDDTSFSPRIHFGLRSQWSPNFVVAAFRMLAAASSGESVTRIRSRSRGSMVPAGIMVFRRKLRRGSQ